MACGTPVIGFDVGGIPELVRHRETGLLAQMGDVESLAEAIVQMMDDQEGRVHMSANCINVVGKEYDVKLQAERYSDVYRSIYNHD